MLSVMMNVIQQIVMNYLSVLCVNFLFPLKHCLCKLSHYIYFSLLLYLQYILTQPFSCELLSPHPFNLLFSTLTIQYVLSLN